MRTTKDLLTKCFESGLPAPDRLGGTIEYTYDAIIIVVELYDILRLSTVNVEIDKDILTIFQPKIHEFGERRVLYEIKIPYYINREYITVRQCFGSKLEVRLPHDDPKTVQITERS